MLERIRTWWAGEFRPTPLDTILKGGEIENIVRPWPVRAGRALWQFYLRHWQWLWGSALGIVLAVIAACDRGPQWTAFVYPDIENIPNADQVQNFTIGVYSSFEECQANAIDRVRNLHSTTGRQGDYQCGYKCTRRDDYGGLLICKETRK